MSDNKRITMDGFSSKVLRTGLSQGELAQRGYTSANLQAALKPAESQPKDGSNGGDQAGAAQKK